MPIERLPWGFPRREKNGRFPAYAWPGGYVILYYFADWEPCCAACANRDNGSEARIGGEAWGGWKLIAAGVYWEGPPIACAHCGVEIESAYGDPYSED